MQPFPSLQAYAAAKCFSLPRETKAVELLQNSLSAVSFEGILEKLHEFPLEVRRTWPLSPEAQISYLEVAIESRIEFLSQFRAEYNNEESFAKSNIRECPKERGQCFVELLKFGQDANCPLPEETINRFGQAVLNLGHTHSLHFIDLSGEDLSGMNLSTLHLPHTNCIGTNFSGATITGTYFPHAKLVDANFSGAQGKYPYFVGADVSDANFTQAILIGAKFYSGFYDTTILVGTNFENATLSKSCFGGTDVTQTNFKGVDLNEVEMMTGSF